MSDEQKIRVCDVCGEPATNWAVDVIRDESGPYVRFSPTAIYHYGCNRHLPKGDVHRTQGRV